MTDQRPKAPGAANQAEGGAGRRPEHFIAEAQALAKQNKLPEAEQVVLAGLTEFPNQRRLLRQSALLAEQAGDMQRALDIWAVLRAHARNASIGYTGALRTLRRFRHLELAPPLLAEALERFPEDVDVIVWAAELADTAKKDIEADGYWQRAVALRPENPDYALSAAMCLFGNPVGRPKRTPEMFRRIEAHHAAFPDHAPAYAAHINLLRETQELEEADRKSAVWCAKFPTHIKLALARLGVLEEQKRFGDAVAFLARIRALFPPEPDIEAGYARALSGAGRHDEAERFCLDAARQFPTHRRVLCEFAHIATRRGEWDLALRRLLDVQKILPNDAFVDRQIQQTRLLMAESAPETAATPQDNLAARFESLGGSGGGCEFGLIQRRMGSDTVGLLRWTKISPDELIDALGCDFEGVGAEENTVLSPRRIAIDQEEWSTTDKRFGMETHTFVRTIDAPEDKMFAQTCRRLRFLRGKMLQDLAGSGKIFTYKALHRMDDAAILALHAALARHGDNALLCVMRAREGETRGTVRDLGRGIYVGYISHFMKDDSGNPGYDLDGWNMVCTATDTIWSKIRPPAEVSEAA